jgi:hypothetical protein
VEILSGKMGTCKNIYGLFVLQIPFRFGIITRGTPSMALLENRFKNIPPYLVYLIPKKRDSRRRGWVPDMGKSKKSDWESAPAVSSVTWAGFQ